jgi:hypothetical protein
MYTCEICSKSFKSRQAVNGHYYTHGGKNNQNYEANHKPRCCCVYTKKEMYADKLDEYFLNLNKCMECGKLAKKDNTFCNASCAAKHSNRERAKSGWTPSEEQREAVRNSLYKFHSDEKNQVKYTRISQCNFCNKWFANNIRRTKRTCSDECRSAILSKTATKNKMMGGNKNTRAHGWYESPRAGRVWLESSYEYKVAVDLDKNNVNWIRPKYLNYGTKKYFADFYLVDYDVYLDPKNDYLITMDQEKIEQVIEENNVRVYILNKHQLSWEYIKGICAVERI